MKIISGHFRWSENRGDRAGITRDDNAKRFVVRMEPCDFKILYLSGPDQGHLIIYRVRFEISPFWPRIPLCRYQVRFATGDVSARGFIVDLLAALKNDGANLE